MPSEGSTVDTPGAYADIPSFCLYATMGCKVLLLTGDQPSPTVHYEGCRFRSRCFRYQALPEDQTQDCRTLDPSLTDPTGTTLGYEGTHGAACFHIEERDVV